MAQIPGALALIGEHITTFDHPEHPADVLRWAREAGFEHAEMAGEHYCGGFYHIVRAFKHAGDTFKTSRREEI